MAKFVDPSDRTLLGRLDRWSERSHWMPGQEQPFPAKVFWGIWIWNFPILLAAFGIIGLMFYQLDPHPDSPGLVTPLPWLAELVLGCLLMAIAVDFAACLWLRWIWNRRARAIARQEAAS